MITIQGKGVSTGIGMGPLYFYRRAKTDIPNYTVEDTKAEWLRFKGAQSVAIDQLGELAEKARVEAGDDAAFLFETHQPRAYEVYWYCSYGRCTSRRSMCPLYFSSYKENQCAVEIWSFWFGKDSSVFLPITTTFPVVS